MRSHLVNSRGGKRFYIFCIILIIKIKLSLFFLRLVPEAGTKISLFSGTLIERSGNNKALSL